MRHKKKGRQLGRQTKHRWALFRNLVTSLIDQERIETTEAKAKEIRGFTDEMITLGKEGSLLPVVGRSASAQQGGRLKIVHRCGAALPRSPGRLYADHQDASARW